MKILYVNLTAPFSLHMMYKENYLIRAFRENEDEVFVLSTLEEFRENKICTDAPGECVVDKNLSIFRVKFNYCVNHRITGKIRKVKGFVKLCSDFAPEIIILNGIQFYNVQELEQIRKVLPEVRIYGDVSAAAYNSATNWISYHLLHKGIYRFWIRKSLQCFDKIFYVSIESKHFLQEMYQIPEELLEEQGLCCEVLTMEKKQDKKKKFLVEKNISQECFIFTHTGKMDTIKNTIPLLEAFAKTTNPNFRLLLAGAFDKEIYEIAMKIIKSDNRIIFIGFLKYFELIELLAATDLYLQPGGPSQTLQTAIGCLCPVVVLRMEIYRELLEDKGIYIDSPDEIKFVFDRVNENSSYLKDKIAGIESIAKKIDYKKVAARFYKDNLCIERKESEIH